MYSSTNGFAYESFLDEMARAAKMDPIAFRRQHFDSPRLHALADKLEAVSGWKQRKAGEGYGMSLTYCFSSWAAHVVKVSKAKAGGITIAQGVDGDGLRRGGQPRRHPPAGGGASSWR
ncbi:MAG: hypothetical protein IPJ56_09355 [Gemmatimonadetes bacterium]|nr:hypothetical protein [Gemmatimonadota bacterium]